MKKKMKSNVAKFLASIVALSAISGCVSSPYVAPEGGALSDLVVRIKPAQATKYSLEVYEDAQACRGGKNLVDDAGKANVSATKIRADQLTTLGYYEVQGNVACQLIISFYPKQNRIYLLDTDWVYGMCSIRLMDSTDMKRPFHVNSIKRNVGGDKCKAIDGPR